jgi:Phosphohistidine phosphatase SixA
VIAVALTLVLGVAAAPGAAQASDIWDDLARADGVVVLYRHARAPGGGDPADFDVEDCATQRNLSAAGRRQAVRMGRQLRENDVPVARVRWSPWC